MDSSAKSSEKSSAKRERQEKSNTLFEMQVSLIKSKMKVQNFIFSLIPQGKPTLFTGVGSSEQLCENIVGFGHRRVLIVTDEILVKLGVLDSMKKVFEENNVEVVVFDGVEPDPTYAVVDKGTEVFLNKKCDAVLAVGGGSSIDAAKVIALAAANKTTNSLKLAGNYKSRRFPKPLYAVPTTAGTGSEVTLAAVISHPKTHVKLPIADHRTLPLAAAIDPEIMKGMPPPITAATGMDALTHAVESFIATTSTRFTERYARSAVRAIFEYLPKAYEKGDDLEAREAMGMASFNAGYAFTKTLVGYVHGIAHHFGSVYGTPHGLANALLLPHVLEFSKDAVEERLAILAEDIGVAKDTMSIEQKAQAFIDSVYELEDRVGVPKSLEALKKEDIPKIAKAALKETHAQYAVPKYMDQKSCEHLIEKLLP
jgi:alcohol dehydrogenase class IV